MSAMNPTLTTLQALQLIAQLLAQAQAVADIIARSSAEKRGITADEWDTILRADDDARKRLQDAIDTARRNLPP